MVRKIAAIALLALFQCLVAADSPFADLMATKMSFYRAQAHADPLIWDDGLADLAEPQAVNCSLLYDYWLPEGQIIFKIVDHWWDMRGNYTPKSDDYDELQPFYWSWEFTQMVWDTNTKVGCSWSPILCPVEEGPASQVAQLVCLFTPGGNKWDQFGAHVHCPDCDAEPQTSTINTATLSWDNGAATEASAAANIKREYNIKYWQAEVDRVEAFQTMALSEFIPGFTPSPTVDKAVVEIAEPTAGLPLRKRATPPTISDPEWQDAYLEKLNGWREQRGMQANLRFDASLADSLSSEYLQGCVWPQSQNVENGEERPWNHVFWLTNDDTSDYYSEFGNALHMWEVWGNGTTSVGSLWTNWYHELTKEVTMKVACGWTPKCDQTKPLSYMMFCIATSQ